MHLKKLYSQLFVLQHALNVQHLARKDLIESLSTHKEVEKVDKVFVDKNETFVDIDNLRWNSVDIFLSTNEKVEVWQNKKFRKQIFSKCKLWATYEDESGEYLRKNVKFRKDQNLIAEMRSMGYHV